MLYFCSYEFTFVSAVSEVSGRYYESIPQNICVGIVELDKCKCRELTFWCVCGGRMN